MDFDRCDSVVERLRLVDRQVDGDRDASSTFVAGVEVNPDQCFVVLFEQNQSDAGVGSVALSEGEFLKIEVFEVALEEVGANRHEMIALIAGNNVGDANENVGASLADVDLDGRRLVAGLFDGVFGELVDDGGNDVLAGADLEVVVKVGGDKIRDIAAAVPVIEDVDGQKRDGEKILGAGIEVDLVAEMEIDGGLLWYVGPCFHNNSLC